ncbi:MAG: LPXTG cell wall anchor domain-containing protein [Clostridiales bacterium]|nr:LPXTG cell wall anchor domain-containing protein [Clostridiales bacterium]
MDKIVNAYVEKFKEKRRRQRRMIVTLAIPALFLALVICWQLHLTGVALTGETYCGLEEHRHTEECYETVLVCGQEESEGHTHDESCYDESGNLICGMEETEGHTHTEDCYEQQLVCGLEEHTHTKNCLKGGATKDAKTAKASETEAEPEAGDEIPPATLTYEDENIIVSVTYSPDAGLPENAELFVAEYEKDSETYLSRYAETVELYGWDEDEDYTDSFRLFDIGFYADGEEVEPADAVMVTISYLNQEAEVGRFTVTHYGDEETETIEADTVYEDGTQVTTFESDSFSEYSLTADGQGGSGSGGTGGTGGDQGGGSQGGGTGGDQGGGQGGDDPDSGGNDPDGGDDPDSGDSGNNETDPSYYNEDSYVFYDTFTPTYNDEGEITSGVVNTAARDYIESVVLNTSTVVQRDSSAAGGWSTDGASQLSTYFPDAYYTDEDDCNMQTVTLTITPKTGYYVTAVVVTCTGGYGTDTAYDCTTFSEGNAFQTSFSVGTSGSVEVSVSSTDFSHRSESPYYFILIAVSPISSPLYVEYDYGEIVTLIDDSTGTYDSAFSTATGWTATSAGNYYGDGYNDSNADTGYTNTDGAYTGYGVMTDDTQYKYAYTSGGTVTAADWIHYANTITASAKEQAAAAGYVFAGWKAEYYTSVTVTENSDQNTSGYQDDYNNWDYAFSDSYGEGTYDEGDQVTLTTNVRLIAQWVPIGITVTKVVTGLTGTSYESSDQTYTLQLQVQGTDGEGNETWTDYGDSIKLTVTVDGTASTTIYPLPAGTYRVVETAGNTDLNDGTYIYYISVDTGGTVTVTYSSAYTVSTVDGSSVALLSDSLTVTNSYSEEPAAVDVILKKVDENGDVLSGAVFTLYSSTTNDTTTLDATGTDGTVTMSDLATGGSYTLQEVTAPDGYNSLTDSITFTVSASGAVTLADGTDSNVASVSSETNGSGNTVYTITVVNTPGYELPETGGSGTWPYILIGLLLSGTAVFLFCRRRRSA